MHPLLLRRLRPIAAVVLVFFSWFSIEPWNFALAAQSPPTPRAGHSSASQQNAPTAPEVFEANLRSIKEQVGSARDGEAYQAQRSALLEALGTAREQSGRELEQARQAVDRLAHSLNRGVPNAEALKVLRAQQQTAKTAIGQVRKNVAGIEGLLRGMALPASLTQNHKQAKEAVASLTTEFEKRLAAIAQRAEQQRGFDSQEHQAFLAASVALEQGLAVLQDRMEALAKEVTPERRRAQLWEQAFSQRDSLLSAHREIRKEFAQTEAFLKEKGLPREILDRHDKAVSDYEKNYNQLKGYFTQVDKAHRAYVSATERGNETAAQAAERDLESKLTAFDDFLKANVKDPPHQALDPNNLPHRTPKVQERKPRLKQEEFAEFQPQVRLAYNGDPGNLMLAQATSGLPTSEDLAETIEVKFTQEIQNLAAEHGHHPVSLYEYVRNTVAFVPYYGSLKGAAETLAEQAGNDADQASLLIALLRASGIPSRYVIGTIEVPIVQAMAWVGVSDPRVAAQLSSGNGIPAGLVISGATPRAIRMEHVWVEAYVPYALYSGRPSPLPVGKRWVPLDPSYKVSTVTPGMNLAAAVPFDGAALLDQVRATATVDPSLPSVTSVDAALIQNTATQYETDLQAYLTQQAPTATVGDVLGTTAIVPETLGILPVVTPYPVLVTGARTSSLPATLQHMLTLDLSTNGTGFTDVTYTAPVASLAGQRLTIAYDAATPTDQATIDGYAAAYATQLPAYLVRVRPSLRLNGATVATGSVVGFGTRQSLAATLTALATGADRVVHALHAGDVGAVGLDVGQVTAGMLEQRTATDHFSGEPVGEMLHQTLLAYWAELDAFNRVTASQSGVISVRHPSEGLATAQVTITELFGAPYRGSYQSRQLDIRRDAQAVFSTTGNAQQEFSYFTQAGLYSSALEGLIFDQLFGGNLGDGVSAVRLLELANSQAIPIYQINASNLTTVLPRLQVGAQVQTDVQNAVHAGRVVTIPERSLTHNGWAGVGYIAQDPTSGAAGYIISGGLAGGTSGTGTSTIIPLPQVPLTGPVALVAGGLVSNVGTFVTNSAGVTVGVSIPTVGEIIAIAILVVIIVELLKRIADKYRIPPNWRLFRHYTTFGRLKGILLLMLMTPSTDGDLGPGVYVTDLFINPAGNAEEIATTLRMDINNVQTYLDIEINLNLVPIVSDLVRFPHQYVVPSVGVRTEVPLFLNGIEARLVAPGPIQ